MAGTRAARQLRRSRSASGCAVLQLGGDADLTEEALAANGGPARSGRRTLMYAAPGAQVTSLKTVARHLPSPVIVSQIVATLSRRLHILRIVQDPTERSL